MQIHRTAAIFSIWLFLLLPLQPASPEPISTQDLSTYKELVQSRLDANRDLLQGKIDALSSKIESQNRLIENTNTHFNFFLVILGLIIAGTGIFGYFSVRDKAKREAEEAAREWFEKRAEELEKEIFALRNAAAEAKAKIENEIYDVTKQASEAKRKIQESIDSTAPGEMEQTPGEQKAPLLQAELSLRKKPVAEYTFSDWDTLAFAAMAKNDLEGAARYWNEAAEIKDIKDVDRARSLFNAGAARTQLKRHREAISSYEQLLDQFGNSANPNLQEQIALALNNEGYSLSQLGQHRKAISLYDQLLVRFRDATNPNLQEQIAIALNNRGYSLSQLERHEEALASREQLLNLFRDSENPGIQKQIALALNSKGYSLSQLERYGESIATYEQFLNQFGASRNSDIQNEIPRALNGKGYALLCRAKKGGDIADTALPELLEAEKLFQEAGATDSQSIKAFVFGNQAYCAHLLQRPEEEVRQKLILALQLGREEIYTATLKDLSIYPTPLDASFQELLEEEWKKIRAES